MRLNTTDKQRLVISIRCAHTTETKRPRLFERLLNETLVGVDESCQSICLWISGSEPPTPAKSAETLKIDEHNVFTLTVEITTIAHCGFSRSWFIYISCF